MGFFKKLGRGIRKTVGKKLIKRALRVGVGLATGGQSEVALRAVQKARTVAKGLGISRRGRKNKSEAVVIAKMAGMAPPQLRTTPSATTMPGGAPLVKSARRGIPSRRSARPKRARVFRSKNPEGSDGYYADLERFNRVPKSKRSYGNPVGVPQKASGSRRKPPKGGKDLKALSASWKAAGKPGRWIDWVKTH